jgi:protein gp37
VATTIEWTEETWNPVTGCDQVSPGCDNCYALTLAKRLKAMGQARYQNDGDPRTSGPGFALTVHPDALGIPLRWRRPRRVFVNSMSDLFHRRVPSDFICQVWEVMARTPQHTYQILTKRPARMAELLGINFPDPLPNVWLGTSVENQRYADLRIPHLLATPAAVRFLSLEPLLGAVDLGIGDPHRGHQADDINGHPHPRVCLTCSTEDNEVEYFRREPSAASGLGWVIAGGESGPGARPMHPDWARSTRDQCTGAGVPFFFKQWGAWAPAPWKVSVEDEHLGATHAVRSDTGHCHELGHKPWSLERREPAPEPWAGLRRVGKKAAGRELDGRTWDQYPEAAARD